MARARCPASWVSIRRSVLCVQLRPSHQAQSPMPKSVYDRDALGLEDLRSDAFRIFFLGLRNVRQVTATTSAFWTGNALDPCSQQRDTATLSQQTGGLLMIQGHLRIRKPKTSISPMRRFRQSGSSQAPQSFSPTLS